MKRLSVHEIIPEKSEEDCEFTISIRDSQNDKNNEHNRKSNIDENIHEEKIDTEIYELNTQNKVKNKLLIGVDKIHKLQEKTKPFNKTINKTYAKEDLFSKRFNSDHGNQSVPVIIQIYDGINRKKQITQNKYNFVINDHSKRSSEHFKEIKLKIVDERNYKNNTIENSKRSKNLMMEEKTNSYLKSPELNSQKNKEEEKFISGQSLTNSEKMRIFIRFKEVWNYFSSIDLSEERNSIEVEDFSKYNCCQLMILKCTKKLVLDHELLDERQLTFSITKIPLNFYDEIHMRTMTTIYQNLTRELDCPVTGEHWVKIGFQSSDPKNDLRSTGMFSMLQILAIMDKFNGYVTEIFEFSKRGFKHNPFACILINMSYYTIQSLKEGILIQFCNKNQSVINTVNEFYFGMVDLFFEGRKNNKNVAQENINDVIKSIAKDAKNNPDKIFERVKILSKKYPLLNKDSMSLGDDINKY